MNKHNVKLADNRILPSGIFMLALCFAIFSGPGCRPGKPTAVSHRSAFTPIHHNFVGTDFDVRDMQASSERLKQRIFLSQMPQPDFEPVMRFQAASSDQTDTANKLDPPESIYPTPQINLSLEQAVELHRLSHGSLSENSISAPQLSLRHLPANVSKNAFAAANGIMRGFRSHGMAWQEVPVAGGNKVDDPKKVVSPPMAFRQAGSLVSKSLAPVHTGKIVADARGVESVSQGRPEPALRSSGITPVTLESLGDIDSHSSMIRVAEQRFRMAQRVGSEPVFSTNKSIHGAAINRPQAKGEFNAVPARRLFVARSLFTDALAEKSSASPPVRRIKPTAKETLQAKGKSGCPAVRRDMSAEDLGDLALEQVSQEEYSCAETLLFALQTKRSLTGPEKKAYALALKQNGRISEAIQIYEWYAQTNPQDTDVFLEYAGALLAMHEDKRFLQIIATQLNQDRIPGTTLAIIDDLLDEFPSARNFENKQYYNTRLLLGFKLLDAHKGITARKQFQLVLSLSPRNPEALIGLAESHISENQKSKALACYRDIIGQFPNNYWLQRRFSEVLAWNGYFSESLAVTTRLVSYDATDLSLHRQTVTLYMAMGRQPMAAEHVQTASKRNPEIAVELTGHFEKLMEQSESTGFQAVAGWFKPEDFENLLSVAAIDLTR